ncbi:MAG TPA: hypothetical protein VFP32_03160 [Candidatus Saccharimonadales bacterium]|nr:hypothetical protein [Candidatus Saccharimonadales bacterium]
MATLEGTPDIPAKLATEQAQPAPEAGSLKPNTYPIGLPPAALENIYVGRMDSLLQSAATDWRKLGDQLAAAQARYGEDLISVPMLDGSILFFVSPEAKEAYDTRITEQILGGTMIDGTRQEPTL